MGFRLIQPKRVKKIKSHDAQEVLDRLEAFLNSNLEEPVRVLCGFWQDQSSAISYQELRQAVLDGALSEQTMREWQHDYSVLVKNSLAPMWKAAMMAGPSGQPVFDGKNFELNMQTPGVLNWINERGAEFVTASTVEQREAIAALLEKKIRDEHTVDELAKMIRPCIGLTDGQAKANVKFYDNIVKTLTEEHPRMSKESIRKKALDASTKYAERQHRQRALTIAHTESAFAYNRGADQGVRQAMDTGLLGLCVKVWSTSGDENVCATCNSLEGTEIGMDESFDFKGRVLFSGHKMLPPAHPMCACAIEYREIEAPRVVQQQEQSALGVLEEESEGVWNKVLTKVDEFTKDVPPIPLEDISGKYADKLLARVAKAPSDHKQLLEAFSDRIGFAKTTALGKIRTGNEGIYVNLRKDLTNPKGPFTSAFHEMGHEVDKILGRISDSIGLSSLIREDAEGFVKAFALQEGYTQEEALIYISDRIRHGNTRETHFASDLLSGVFGEKYDWLWSHDDTYWNKDSMRLGREGFAHFFGATARNDARKIDVLQTMFPRSYEAYLKAVEEAAKNV